MAFHLFDCEGSIYLTNDEKGYPEAAANRAMQSAMQRIGEIAFLRLWYHETPNDLFELFVSLFSDVDEHGWGKEGLNVFRLVNKRLRAVVEACATRLRNPAGSDGPTNLPTGLLSRCKRVKDISCYSWNLVSLQGLPKGLKRLYLYGENVSSLEPLSSCTCLERVEIYRAPLISDLAPLRSCSGLKRFLLDGSKIVDLSPLSSLPLLEALTLRNSALASIKDLSPLSSCIKLKELSLGGNSGVEDLSPLSCCLELEELRIERCARVDNLAPLASLPSLRKLCARGIDPRASFFPLAFCSGLTELGCGSDAVDLDELIKMHPKLRVDSD